MKWSCFLGQDCGSAKDVIGSVSCRLLGSFCIKECVFRGLLVESCVRPLSVVEAKPVFDHAFGLKPALRFMQIKQPPV